MKLGKLILLPGLGADGRVFDAQRGLPVEVVTPPWIEPLVDEPLASYAERLSQRPPFDVRCGDGDAIWLGGVSFGGMVALEAAQHIPVRGVLLIASARSGAQVPRSLHVAEHASRWAPDSVLEWGMRRAPLLGAEFRRLTLPQKRLLREMLLATPLAFLRWGGRAIIKWQGPGESEVPVHHLHGSDDRIIPLRNVSPDLTVVGAGHLVNMTHAGEVNGFIEARLRGGTSE
ncbi:MAG: alpha/beta fold hydrolase [Phycisphaerales bacterium]|nr:alpha/beta fold hydrolase [Phycisphaerales bacterium]